jgi:hypothetical protein
MLYLADSDYSPVKVCLERGNESSGSVGGEKSLDLQKDFVSEEGLCSVEFVQFG